MKFQQCRKDGLIYGLISEESDSFVDDDDDGDSDEGKFSFSCNYIFVVMYS